MTQRIKLLVLIISTLCLTHCADGPNGRHIFGLGMTGQPNNTQQVGHAFTNGNNGQYPVSGLLQAFLSSRQQPGDQAPAPESIDYSTEVNWNAACKDFIGGNDTDKDGLPDDCEVSLFKQNVPQYAALDPNTYNGWILGGRYFDGKDTKLDLTDDEAKEWLKDKNERGGIGFGNISNEAQRVIKKFSVIKKTSMSDVYPWAEIFYNYSQEPIRVGDNFHSYKNDLFQINQNDDQNLALATGDNDQSLPYHRNKPANSVAGLTAFGKDTDSYREHHKFKMITYETNVKIPAGIDGLQVTVGYLSGENPYLAMTPKSGAYYVMNNGDTVLLQNQLLNDHGQVFQGSHFGTIYRSTGCDTAHLIVVYVTSGNTDDTHTPILPEVVAFRTGEGQKWSTLGQGYFSIQPQGGITCQQTFNANDPSNTKTFFRTSLNVGKRVNGVADFNSSLGTSGVSNPFKMLDKKSATLDYIKSALKDKPITSMTAQELADFKNALYNINDAGLSADDKTWLAGINKQVSDREDQIKQENVVNGQLKQLEQLLSDPDYAKNAAAIDGLIATLNANTLLTPAQKQKLADLTSKNTTLKTPAPPKVDPKVITFTGDKSATIPLTVDDMTLLRDLGFTLKDKDGNIYDPKAGETQKITQEQLDQILALIGDDLNNGKVDPAKLKNVSLLVDSLKKKKEVNQDKVNDFVNAHGDQFAPMASKWSPDLLNYLASLDAAGSKVKPGLTEDLKKWSKGFPDQTTSDAAKKDAVDKISKNLMDPRTKDFTTAERKAVVDDMQKQGLIDATKAEELKAKIDARDAFVDAQGNYHPEYANLITLIKITKSDGSQMAAFKFNSTINFATGSSTMDKNGKNVVDSFASFVNLISQNSQSGEKYFKVDAYTDATGTPAKNLTVSQKRAAVVSSYLTVKTQTTIDHIQAEGKGIDPNHQGKYNKKTKKYGPDENARRVEILFSSEPFEPKKNS